MPRDFNGEKKDNKQISAEEKFKPQEDKLKPFGYELFSGELTTFRAVRERTSARFLHCWCW